MQIQFIGATGTVTGSKYLLQTAEKKILLDCGLFQGLKVLRLRNWANLPFDPATLDAVVLTHAHIDHSGYLPLLVKSGFRGKIYSTYGTLALCKILLPDAAHLQQEDANFLNRHQLSKHNPALPLYDLEDVEKTLKLFEPVHWGDKISFASDLSFEFFSAGHIVGAAMVRFHHGKKRTTFSGDLGRPNSLLMSAPVDLPETDTLILESTYGDRKHAEDDPLLTLKELILKTQKRGGVVLIPSFAVGRAQEILYLILKLKQNHEISNLPVYLNSPMSVKATKVYADFYKEHHVSSKDCDEIFKTTEFAVTEEDSRRLNANQNPCVIISASGMATGGRVLHHLKTLLPDPKNLILFAGFQAPGTRGEAMLKGVESVKIHGQSIPVLAEVASLDSLSAHADADEILAWLKKSQVTPKRIFITHGEASASEALRKRILEELHWDAEIPDYLQTFEV